MKKLLIMLLALVMLLGLAGTSMATNGTNLIGIGPISRAMGGVGIAAPQDAISATFANPAGMCFGPYCPGSEVNFSGTVFLPRPSTRAYGPFFGGMTFAADSDKKAYAIPAFGLSVPITSQWRFGLSAYGVSGLGVDYRDTNEFSQASMGAGLNDQLQVLKFSPNVAYQVNDNLSLGIGLHIDYSSLDLGQGSSFGYGVGVQVGAIFKVNDYITLGATYKSPQSVDHENVADFNMDGIFDDLELEAPQEVGVGIAVEPIPGTLLIEVDGKWINWGGADGYEDFGWDDQIVVAVGAQVKPIEKLALRVGYNYGKSPVDEHPGFGPFGTVNVQGVPVSRFNYEYLRIVGFPAIVEHHVTAGIGYEVTDSLAFNIGYMHAFEETISESASLFGFNVATIESTLDEDSIEFGLTWRFK